MSIVTLTTDFGISDHFVGVMKGVILSVNPAARIVDITHQVPAQDVLAAAFLIPDFFRYFPEGSVHAVVVDPGVGTERSALAIRTGGHFFVGPDNGLFTLLLESNPAERIVELRNEKYFLPSVGRTFHGRDIFAPVAAHLSKGVSISSMGPDLDPAEIVRTDIPRPGFDEAGELDGKVISVDRFGNLVTNIPKGMLDDFVAGGKAGFVIRVGAAGIDSLSGSYQDVEPGRPLAVIGSRGMLEISVNGGSAAERFGASTGDRVKVSLEKLL